MSINLVFHIHTRSPLPTAFLPVAPSMRRVQTPLVSQGRHREWIWDAAGPTHVSCATLYEKPAPPLLALTHLSYATGHGISRLGMARRSAPEGGPEGGCGFQVTGHVVGSWNDSTRLKRQPQSELQRKGGRKWEGWARGRAGRRARRPSLPRTHALTPLPSLPLPTFSSFLIPLLPPIPTI